MQAMHVTWGNRRETVTSRDLGSQAKRIQNAKPDLDKFVPTARATCVASRRSAGKTVAHLFTSLENRHMAFNTAKGLDFPC